MMVRGFRNLVMGLRVFNKYKQLSVLLMLNGTVTITVDSRNSMGPWKKFESTVVWLERSYENTGSVVCLTTKGRQLEQNFEDILKDMLEVKKFRLLLQLLIKSNIFSNLSKLRNYTSSLIKINFRQVIQ
jgi:hypothetical protein